VKMPMCNNTDEGVMEFQRQAELAAAEMKRQEREIAVQQAKTKRAMDRRAKIHKEEEERKQRKKLMLEGKQNTPVARSAGKQVPRAVAPQCFPCASPEEK